jgi:hypothetical protein
MGRKNNATQLVDVQQQKENVQSYKTIKHIRLCLDIRSKNYHVDSVCAKPSFQVDSVCDKIVPALAQPVQTKNSIKNKKMANKIAIFTFKSWNFEKPITDQSNRTNMNLSS